MIRAAIYARVSTKDKQEVTNQLDQLRTYCGKQGYTVHREYIDHESGGNPDRTEFKALFLDAHQRKYDVLVFWALDRFSREGAKETINYLSELEGYGVNFTSYTEPYLNSLGVFKDAIISLLATLAKQEKIRIRERVIAGLATAKKKGKVLGRRALAPITRKQIIEAHLADPAMSVRKLAKATKQTPATVHKTLSLFRSGNLVFDDIDSPANPVYRSDDLRTGGVQ